MLSLVSGWYPHYLVVEKAYHAVLKYYIERPNDRFGLNNSINGLMTDSGLRLGTKDKTKRKQKEGKYGIKKLT